MLDVLFLSQIYEIDVIIPFLRLRKQAHTVSHLPTATLIKIFKGILSHISPSPKLWSFWDVALLLGIPRDTSGILIICICLGLLLSLFKIFLQRFLHTINIVKQLTLNSGLCIIWIISHRRGFQRGQCK